MAEEVVNYQEIIEQKDAKIAELEARVHELETADHMCKRCGRYDTDKELTVREDVLKEYFRSVLGQRPFKYALRAFDGMLTMEFTLQRGDILMSSLRDTPNSDDTDSGIEQFMMSTLSAVTITDKEQGLSRVLYAADDEALKLAVDNHREQYEKLVKSVDAVQLSVIRQASALFNMLVARLMNTVADEGFYASAGLD